MLDFNLKKIFFYLCFYEHKTINRNYFTLFRKQLILGCYNSTPLKMNLVPEIRRRRAKNGGILQLGIFITFLSNTILTKIPLDFAHLLTFTPNSILADPKMLIGPLIISQVSPNQLSGTLPIVRHLLFSFLATSMNYRSWVLAYSSL